MKKLFLLLAAGLVSFSGVSYAADGAATLYNAKCVSCHGKEGKGNPAMAKIFKVELAALDLTTKAVQDKKDEELTALTTNGKGKMPAYKGKIADADIAGLTTYIRTLVKK